MTLPFLRPIIAGNPVRRQNRAGVSPSPVISTEAVQSPDRKHGCKETRPADCSAMRTPRRTCRSIEILDVSVERSSPRGYAFFVPFGGGESRPRITPTFTERKHCTKSAFSRQPPRRKSKFWKISRSFSAVDRQRFSDDFHPLRIRRDCDLPLRATAHEQNPRGQASQSARQFAFFRNSSTRHPA